MKKETREVWITKDGQEFDSYEAAELHALETDFIARCNAENVYWRDPDVNQVARIAVAWMQAHLAGAGVPL